MLADFAARGHVAEADSDRRVGRRRPVGAGGDRSADEGDRSPASSASGLPDVNELGWRWKDALIYVTHGVPNEPTFSTAAIVDRVSPLRSPRSTRRRTSSCRVAEVQKVLDAAKEPKRLWIVKAADHRFSDNLAEFDRRLLEAIAWVTAERARAEAPVSERLRQALPVVIGLVLFLAALEVLRVELRAVSWHELTADVLAHRRRRGSRSRWLLTALNYAALTGYDLLAFAYIGKTLPRPRIALASFLAYAIANNVGFAMLSGASVRYRFYTRWGVTAEELSRIVFSYSVTFWLGLLALGGLSLAVSPLPDARELPAHQLAGAGRLAPDAGAAGLSASRRSCGGRRCASARFELPLPSPAIAVGADC